jgi:hypothetical protein
MAGVSLPLGGLPSRHCCQGGHANTAMTGSRSKPEKINKIFFFI